MWIKALHVIGWLTTLAGIGIFLLCLWFYLNPSPGDFEGLLAMSSIVVILTIALPAFAIGLVIVAITSRDKSKPAT